MSVQRREWATAVGACAIVLAGLGFMLGLVKLFAAMFVAPSGPDLPPPLVYLAAERAVMGPIELVDAALLVILATLLMTAGIGLTFMAQWSVSVLRIWAVFQLCAVIATAVVGAAARRDLFNALGGTNVVSGGFALHAIDLMYRVLATLVFPGFVLFWLSRRKNGTETSRVAGGVVKAPA